MRLALHSLTTMHCNCLTEVRLARDLDYQGIEFMVAKFLRYLDQGGQAATLRAACEQAGTPAVCLNALVPCDRFGKQDHQALLEECERLSAAAAGLGCPTIQLVFLTQLAGYPWPEVRRLTAQNAAELADIGRAYGIRFQLEPIAWRKRKPAFPADVDVIEVCERDMSHLSINFESQTLYSYSNQLSAFASDAAAQVPIEHEHAISWVVSGIQFLRRREIHLL